MNILKKHINCKQIYNNCLTSDIASTIPLSKIPANYRQDKEFLRSGRYGFVIPANCNFSQSQAEEETKDQIGKGVIELSITDKHGVHKFLRIIMGNTLIISEGVEEVLDRSLQFHKIYLQHGFVTKLISFREFAALSFEEQINPDIHYIVRFNKHDDIDKLSYPLSTMFSNIFVFALNSIDTRGHFVTEIKAGSRAGDILSRLAISTFHARKYLLPFLEKDEFLIIDGNYETLASISRSKV